MQLNQKEIHVWSTSLETDPDQQEQLFTLLSPDERVRAKRFVFLIHQQRFIVAHGILRKILGLYLSASPASITFNYSKHDKPSLPSQAKLQFNLSHSENRAVYALTLNGNIGIDIEKIGAETKTDVAKRYFSQQEIAALQSLNHDEQIDGFYKIWSRKEAVIKANGKGLSIPLSSFSVTTTDSPAQLTLENHTWTVIPLKIDPNYASALAIDAPTESISFWSFSGQVPELCSKIDLPL